MGDDPPVLHRSSSAAINGYPPLDDQICLLPGCLIVALLLGKVGIFFGITTSLGIHVYPRVSQSMKALKLAAVEFSALMAVGLAYGLLAEALGMHWILGAFMAGLYFEPS